MRVICTRIFNPVTGSEEGSSAWLTIDAEYEVLEIYAPPSGSNKLRLVSDDGRTPALFDSAMFVALDNSVPHSWIVSLSDGGELRIGPREWMREGFWQGYFDNDPGAVSAYQRGVERASDHGS